jgi:hypothetical protein
MNIESSNRIALITQLAEKSPGLGRTALMKYCYFLQTLRRVPLRYSFSLYSYGPFDSDVLADLDTTESMGGVTTAVVYYPGGYGYRIEPGSQTDTAKRRGAEFVGKYEGDIEWVVAQFGSLGAGQLELAGTIVYADREATAKSEKLTPEQLGERVHYVKPHFSIDQILSFVQDLKGRGILRSV